MFSWTDVFLLNIFRNVQLIILGHFSGVVDRIVFMAVISHLLQ